MKSIVTTVLLASGAIANPIVYQSPIVVNDAYVAAYGNVVTGNYKGTSTQPAISVATSQPVTITRCNLAGTGDLISGSGVNLTVSQNRGVGLNPNVSGEQKGMFVNIYNAVNLTVENNTVSGVTFGVYVNGYIGNSTPAQTIHITANVFSNMDARPSNGSGGYVTSGEYNGHAIQFNQVHRIPYSIIAWNQIINVPRQGTCSDLINMYMASGTSYSHILIHDNYLQGAYPTNPGEKYTGGGIITDGGAYDTPANSTAYIDAFNNQIVSSANYGISIAAGHDNTFYDNRIISCGYLADGTFIPMSYSNGINNYNNYSQGNGTFFNNLTEANFVGFIAASGTNNQGGGALPARRSDTYLPAQTTNTNASIAPVTNVFPTIAVEQQELAAWNQRARAAGMSIGVGWRI